MLLDSLRIDKTINQQARQERALILAGVDEMTKGEALARLRDLGKEGSSEAFILRKQAEALCACAEELKMSNRYEDPIFIRGMATAHGFITGTAQTLIDEAAKAEGADNAG